MKLKLKVTDACVKLLMKKAAVFIAKSLRSYAIAKGPGFRTSQHLLCQNSAFRVGLVPFPQSVVPDLYKQEEQWVKSKLCSCSTSGIECYSITTDC